MLDAPKINGVQTHMRLVGTNLACETESQKAVVRVVGPSTNCGASKHDAPQFPRVPNTSASPPATPNAASPPAP